MEAAADACLAYGMAQLPLLLPEQDSIPNRQDDLFVSLDVGFVAACKLLSSLERFT